MKNRIRTVLPGLALLLFCGCLDYTDKLTINPDGSGVVHIEVRTTLPVEMFEMMGGGMPGADAISFPPMSKRGAAKVFPAKDFVLSFKQDSRDSETNHVVIDAKFKDIAALLNS